MDATDLNNFWMPFTANRQFKASPRMIESAEGLYYKTQDGRRILDGTSGLWCCNHGHNHPKMIEAVTTQLQQLDYAPSFQVGHTKSFELATKLANFFPIDMNKIFFTNSGSESVETSLKIALAYHRAKGNGSKFRLIGRERGYHGVNFGGTSVGGIVSNRKYFGSLLAGVDHIGHTHDLERNAFTKGMPSLGAEYAEDLLRLIDLHDASTIAAVIIEPVAGSTGVLIPPIGYLERIREICDEHNILLIFDEVITGFGRLGSPFATDFFGIVPDIITLAKGLTGGIIPLGAVVVKDKIHDAFMTGDESLIELFHGYTYSGNPVACAAGLASLEIYESDNLFENANSLTDYWQESIHNLRGLPAIIDIRNLGLIGAIELEGIEGKPSKRAFNAFLRAYEKGLLIRTTGDTIALSPPLNFSKKHIDELFSILAEVLQGKN